VGIGFPATAGPVIDRQIVHLPPILIAVEPLRDGHERLSLVLFQFIERRGGEE
jgi:hypothetical protein